MLQFKSDFEKEQINKYCTDFRKLYSEIQALCPATEHGKEDQNTEESTEESEVSDSSYSESESSNMAKFDLKIALSLLPVMTDKEDNTKELIDGIEYYGSTLATSEISQLISFVLKTRLSQSAKLKILDKYEVVADLLEDMRMHLLPLKAATALQSKLLTISQKERSVSNFGQELSELFRDLTISQANGNTDHYKILCPLNENFAIKRFADGLRNRRIGTIISARDYKSLKDAIQGAQEEEMTSVPGSADILGMRRQGRGNFTPRRSHRGQRDFYTRGPRWSRGPNHNYRNTLQPLYQTNTRGWPRGAASRGRYNFQRRPYTQRNVHVMTPGSRVTTDESERDQTHLDSLNHFFRA